MPYTRRLTLLIERGLLRTLGHGRTSENPVNAKFAACTFSDVGEKRPFSGLLAQIVFYVMDHRAAGREAIARRKRKGYPPARRQPR